MTDVLAGILDRVEKRHRPTPQIIPPIMEPAIEQIRLGTGSAAQAARRILDAADRHLVIGQALETQIADDPAAKTLALIIAQTTFSTSDGRAVRQELERRGQVTFLSPRDLLTAIIDTSKQLPQQQPPPPPPPRKQPPPPDNPEGKGGGKGKGKDDSKGPGRTGKGAQQQQQQLLHWFGRCRTKQPLL